VIAVEGAGLVLLMGACIGTANGAHPADRPMLSIALYALYATPPVSLVLLLMGPRVRRGATVAWVLLLVVVAVAFGAIGTSVSLEPV
jgi:hypothetical protein